MNRTLGGILGAVILAGAAAGCSSTGGEQQATGGGEAASVASVERAPAPAPYRKVSELVKLPDFLPGLGQLWVDPKTLPAGPFLAYDHQGKLVSTIYMIPVKDIQDQKKFDDLKSPGGDVDHISMYYNAGHPGVPDPHYHVVMWHVPKDQEQLVGK